MQAESDDDVRRVAGDGVEVKSGVTGAGGAGAAGVLGMVVVKGVDSGDGSSEARLLATLAVDKDEITLNAELVAVKEPDTIVGTVGARDMVGVVGRP